MTNDARQDTATCGIHGSFYSGYPKCPTCADMQNDARQEPVAAEKPEERCAWPDGLGFRCRQPREVHTEPSDGRWWAGHAFEEPTVPVAAAEVPDETHSNAGLGTARRDFDFAEAAAEVLEHKITDEQILDAFAWRGPATESTRLGCDRIRALFALTPPEKPK